MTSLNPNTRFTDSSAATPVLKLICPNLVRLDSSLQIQPELAESWTCSTDGLRYRFKLRPGLRFHNGERLDAQAVEWNFRRIFDPRNDSPLAADFDLLESVECIGEEEVEFTLKHPFPAFLYHLAGRCHLVADTAIQPIGAGPYRLVAWEQGRRLVLERFEDYWDPSRSLVDEIIVTWAPDTETRVQIIKDGAFDVMESVPTKFAAELEASGLVCVLTSASTSRFTLAFNCSESPFDDVRLRTAVANAIDCDKLVSKFMAPSGSDRRPGEPGNTSPGSEKTVDPSEVRKLLAEAGYPKGITVRTVTTAVSPLPQIAQEVKSMLAPLGIHLDIRDYDDPPWWPHIYIDGSWQLAFQTMGTRSHPDALYRREFSSSGSFNATGYSNPELDRILTAAQCATDDAERKNHYEAAEAVIQQDLPVVVLCATQTVAGIRPGVENFEAHPLGYWNLHEVAINDAP